MASPVAQAVLPALLLRRRRPLDQLLPQRLGFAAGLPGPKAPKRVFLGLDSLSILFKDRFQKPDLCPTWGFEGFLEKKDPWKEWKWKVPLKF